MADLPDPDAPVGPDPAGSGLTLRARFPGEAGRMRVTFTLQVRQQCPGRRPQRGPNLTRVHEFDTVWAVTNGSLPGGLGPGRPPRRGHRRAGYLAGAAAGPSLDRRVGGLPADGAGRGPAPDSVDSRGLPVFGPRIAIGEFGFDPRAIGTGISTVLTAEPPTRRQELTVPIALEGVADLSPGGSNAEDALPGALAEAIFGASRADRPPRPARPR